MEYYQTTYFMGDRNEVAKIERDRMGRMPERIALLAELATLAPPPARLLDIGCDKGDFLDEARRHGYDVAGVEPSDRARQYCGNIGLDVAARLQDVQGQFDLITMQHSLEHFPDPLPALQMVRQLLKPDGHLVVRVPDFACAWSRLRKEKWVWFQYDNHYFHYSERSLQRLLTRGGFRVKSAVSRRPNSPLTVAGSLLSSAVFRGRGEPPSFRARVGAALEVVTGVELFAVATRAE